LFRIQNGKAPENIEVDYPDTERVRSEALRLAGESIQEMSFLDNSDWSLKVTDAAGEVVISVTVTLTAGS
jgi:hypothetical protein